PLRDLHSFPTRRSSDLYALAAIVLLVFWDVVKRGREGLLGVAGSPIASLGFIVAVLGVVPLALYIASYQPYFSLGHSFKDLLSLDRKSTRLNSSHLVIS